MADLEGDGVLEIVAGHAAGVSTNQVEVYDPSGTIRSGWPAKRPGEPGYGAGLLFDFGGTHTLDLEVATPTSDLDASDGDDTRFWLNYTLQL